MMEVTPEKYKEKSKEALQDPVLQKALDEFQHRFGLSITEHYKALPEGPALRRKAHDIRMHAIEHLDVLLERLADKIQRNGGHVFFAADGRVRRPRGLR